MGFGTVGRGTYRILTEKAPLIRARTGAALHVEKILFRNLQKAEAAGVLPLAVTKAEDILQDPAIDIVIEAIGGIDPASSYIEQALRAGKSVVTPNKAAVAAHLDTFTALAKENGSGFYYEACVGGGIPALTAVREALSANSFLSVSGIVNGTTNFILTKMETEGMSYAEALKLAQKNGFAEADPTADVEGIDAANKLAILLGLCFGVNVLPEDIPREGISKVTQEDIVHAKKCGKRIKLLAHASRRTMPPADDLLSAEEDSIRAAALTFGVGLQELPLDHPLAGVSDEFNAIYVTGDAAGELMFYGKGAGALPTGSAVCGDVIAAAKKIISRREAPSK